MRFKNPDEIYGSKQKSAVNKNAHDRLSKDETKGEVFINRDINATADQKYYQQQHRKIKKSKKNETKEVAEVRVEVFDFTEESDIKQVVVGVIKALNDGNEVVVNTQGSIAKARFVTAIDAAVSKSRITRKKARSIQINNLEVDGSTDLSKSVSENLPPDDLVKEPPVPVVKTEPEKIQSEVATDSDPSEKLPSSHHLKVEEPTVVTTPEITPMKEEIKVSEVKEEIKVPEVKTTEEKGEEESLPPEFTLTSKPTEKKEKPKQQSHRGKHSQNPQTK